MLSFDTENDAGAKRQVPELRPIPEKIISKLKVVPKKYVNMLAKVPAILDQLPIRVKQQVSGARLWVDDIAGWARW